MYRTITFLAGLSITSVAAFSQSSQTLTGTVTDTMCGAKHMMTNVTPAQCTRECVKQGSDYALVSNGKVYTLKGDTKQIHKYAGEAVTVTGKIEGSTVTVTRFRQPSPETRPSTMRLSDQARNTLTRLAARTAYLSGHLDRDAPFTLLSDSPHVQFNSGGPYWQEQVSHTIINELLENGLIARSSDSTKSANQVFRITERGRNCLVNGLASSAEGV